MEFTFNSDGSNTVSLSEYAHGIRQHFLGKDFERRDRNKDGKLDIVEAFQNRKNALPRDMSTNHPSNHKGKHHPDDFHGSVWARVPSKESADSHPTTTEDKMDEVRKRRH